MSKENVFDETGQIVEDTEENLEPILAEGDNEEPEETVEEPEAAPKYRIGDREFATQEEALAFAQSQLDARDTEIQVTDAYRQGLLDAQKSALPPVENVTPEKPQFNTEELYTNPDQFLSKFAQQIKTETQAELDQKAALKQQSDQIWREFSERHPVLADFRQEVEEFVSKNTADVRAIIGTKGRPASYDYIAMKVKSRFEAYANAAKPRRELANGKNGASPTMKVTNVTPPAPAKKPLSMAEQIRNLRKGR